MRVRLVVGSQQVECNEVIQCKLFQDKQKNNATCEKEKARAEKSDSDVFLLITSAELSAEFALPALPPRCGIVSKDEFLEYVGPFASRAYRSLPNINTASYHELCLIEGVGDATAKMIIREKKKRGRVSSHEDAVSRLRLSKSLRLPRSLPFDGEGEGVVESAGAFDADQCIVFFSECVGGHVDSPLARAVSASASAFDHVTDRSFATRSRPETEKRSELDPDEDSSYRTRFIILFRKVEAVTGMAH